jgi:hypothetical protein
MVNDAVPVLVTDHRLNAGRIERLFDFNPFGAAHRHRLLKRNQPRATLDPDANHLAAQGGKRAEAEDVRLDGQSQPPRVRIFSGAELLSGRLHARRINVAHAHDFEAAIGLKSAGVMQPALSHADHNYPVCVAHFALRSHSRTLSTV